MIRSLETDAEWMNDWANEWAGRAVAGHQLISDAPVSVKVIRSDKSGGGLSYLRFLDVELITGWFKFLFQNWIVVETLFDFQMEQDAFVFIVEYEESK